MGKGKDKKRFNVKGRQKSEEWSGKRIDSKNLPLQVEVDKEAFAGTYDESNPLLLPSKKKEKSRGKGREIKTARTKILTKKQRKKLQQIVDRREKKGSRADLLAELQKHQLSSDIFKKLKPLVQVQTEGLKKLIADSKKDLENHEMNSTGKSNGAAVEKKFSVPKSSIKGASKTKYLSWSGRFQKDVIKNDPKVLGLNEESSDEEETTIKEEIDSYENEDAIAIDDEDLVSVSFEAEKVSKVPILPSNDEKRTQTKASLLNCSTSESNEVAAAPVVKKTFVPVNRTKEIELVRSKLPIIAEEQVIMESITENLVTVLAGETGSGKTTQVPQFLYEAGYTINGKMIGVTEPRRVAAISMSMRVAKELNVSTEVVSYQIRYEGNVSRKTQIKFMTDGVLLKEMEKDFLLSKYAAICIDEAHERSLYTDILIGLLSRCVKLRKKKDSSDPLKLIIMSATMRVEDFVENSVLFKIPPKLIHVPTRQFPVQIHFSKHTPDNYVIAAYKKAAQIHRKLPAGGILIFLTGQQEVRTVVKQLRKRFSNNEFVGEQETLYNPGKNQKIKKRKNKSSSSQIKPLTTFDLDKLQALPLKSEEDYDNVLYNSEEELDEWDESLEGSTEEASEPLYVLPLYSMLPSAEQQKVFETPPRGSRLCVVATNVAETSLTIPSIRYVVDSGKVKLKIWDKLTGVQQFKVSWESKASAEQRGGRAGRTGPGHCYRLFSSAVFDSEFESYSKPEIQVRPVDDMMLLMKSIGIDRVQNFPYPSPPAQDQLIAAEKTLLNLGALTSTSNSNGKKKLEVGCMITELGKTMAHFPLGPRFSKMVALSFQNCLAEYAIALVSALTVQEVFLDVSLHDSSKETKSSWVNIRRKWAGTGAQFLLGDCMVLLRAVGAFEYAGASPEFCIQSGLRHKAMLEIRKLRKQLTEEVNLCVSSGQEIPLNPHMQPPTEEQSVLLRQIVLSGLPDRIARKIVESELKAGEDPKIYKNAYRCGELEDPVFIHTASSLRSSRPDWVVFQELFETNGKMYIKGVTAIEPEWIPIFCKNLCKFENPLRDPPPCYDVEKGTVYCSVKATYGKQGWELPIVQIEYPLILEKYKLFAQFLLEGKVFPKLQKWRSKLLSLPVTMTKPWAKLQPRTQTLLSALTKNGIHSKTELLQKWGSSDKNFLLQEYLEWIPEDEQSNVTLEWPPLLDD